MPRPSPHTSTPQPSAGRRTPGTDRLIRTAAASAVAALAVVTAAVSYAHMRVLADRHGETGWRGHAFPLSVDGIEIVASLVLLANRRAGRASGWLVWAALAAGTAASMAANVAVGPADPIGRIVAGWPAFALLVAIKLLTGLAEHPPAPPPRPRTDRPPGPRTTGRRPSSGPGSPVAQPSRPRPAGGPAAAAGPDIADLIPIGRSVQAAVTADGRTLTRELLRQGLRTAGIGVSNARLSRLLRALATETGPAPPPTT
jgi:hypothetical protein